MGRASISTRQWRLQESRLPGRDMIWEKGSGGTKVRQMQEQLNVIAQAYPALPMVDADGIFGPETKAAVEKFQSIFGLPGDRNRGLSHLV